MKWKCKNESEFDFTLKDEAILLLDVYIYLGLSLDLIFIYQYFPVINNENIGNDKVCVMLYVIKNTNLLRHLS